MKPCLAFLVVAASLLGLARLPATDVPPGATVPLLGVEGGRPEWAGIVVNDQFHSFEIKNGAGTVILRGQLQDLFRPLPGGSVDQALQGSPLPLAGRSHDLAL